MDISYLLIFTIPCLLLLHGTSGSFRGENNYKPKFTDGLPGSVTINGKIGKNVKLLCKVDSNPASFTKWKKRGDTVPSSKRIRIFKHSLLIKKARAEDAGEYHCKASNPFGHAVRQFVVNMSIVHDEEDRNSSVEEIKLLKTELLNLTQKVKKLSQKDVHLHFSSSNRQNEEEDMSVKYGTHVYINLVHNDHSPHDDSSVRQEETQANCAVVPNNNSSNYGLITGNIHLIQKGKGSVEVNIQLTGFDMTHGAISHQHGIHIHQFGDLSNSCDSLGNVYETDKTESHGHHAKRKSIMCDDNGEVHLQYTDNTLRLHGKHSVIGRSFVIHDGGNGKRIACCVIGRSNARSHGDMDREIIQIRQEELLEHHKEPIRLNPRFPNAESTTSDN